MLYAFFCVIHRCLKFKYQRFGTLCLFHLHRRVGMKCIWIWNVQSVQKRWHINYRLQWITQKKENNKQIISGVGLFFIPRANTASSSSTVIMPCDNALICIDCYELVSAIIYHCPVLMPRATPRPLSAVVTLFTGSFNLMWFFFYLGIHFRVICTMLNTFFNLRLYLWQQPIATMENGYSFTTCHGPGTWTHTTGVTHTNWKWRCLLSE
jgi:hypothetical protein